MRNEYTSAGGTGLKSSFVTSLCNCVSLILLASNSIQRIQQVNTALTILCVGMSCQRIVMSQLSLSKGKKSKDYAVWRQFNEKPSAIPGCPGELFNSFGRE